MTTFSIAIWLTIVTAIALRITAIWRSERATARASRAAGQLLAIGYTPRIPAPIHPHQDVTGDMPEKSPVQREIEEVQARSAQFGGDQNLREDSRWKARFTEARPEGEKRDWA